MSNAVRFAFLQSSATILSDLHPRVQAAFLDDCELRSYRAKDVILQQGDAVRGMYIVADGSVEITSENDQKQTVLIHMHGDGDTFGEIEAFALTPAAATCRAFTSSKLLFAPLKLLLEAAKTPIFLRNVFRSTHARLVRDNKGKFVDQFYPVEMRLCDVLYRLSAAQLEIPRTQADLAGLLGCARQTLNRELGHLRDNAIIAVKKGRIHGLDRGALLARASGADNG